MENQLFINKNRTAVFIFWGVCSIFILVAIIGIINSIFGDVKIAAPLFTALIWAGAFCGSLFVTRSVQLNDEGISLVSFLNTQSLVWSEIEELHVVTSKTFGRRIVRTDFKLLRRNGKTVRIFYFSNQMFCTVLRKMVVAREIPIIDKYIEYSNR
jgi:hypothetical protein